jgi:hypothetical protein
MAADAVCYAGVQAAKAAAHPGTVDYDYARNFDSGCRGRNELPARSGVQDIAAASAICDSISSCVSFEHKRSAAGKYQFSTSCHHNTMVRRCRLIVSNPELKARPVSALETQVNCDEPHSSFAVNFNLRRCTMVRSPGWDLYIKGMPSVLSQLQAKV